MPILIENNQFTDAFGNSSSFYISNAGDKTTLEITLRSQIRISSLNDPLVLDPSLTQISMATSSWIDEGFRTNDWVRVTIYSSGGTILNAFETIANYVDDNIMDLNGIPSWYDVQNGEFVVIYALQASGSLTARGRDDLDVLLNHVQNSSSGTEFSLIDGEVTRSVFVGVAAMSIGATINGVLTGNQSGQFLESATFERLADGTNYWLRHKLTIVFSNSGGYDSTWFNSSNCLKAFVKFLWASIGGEPYARAEAVSNLSADTGYFNEPHNTSPSNSSILQTVSEIDYCNPTTFNVVVDSPTTEIGFGSMYISDDENYYKNRTFSQNEITMIIPTTPAAIGVFNSYANEFGAAYTIEINSITQVLTQTTLNITLTPNPQFNTFIDGVDLGDRLFVLWVKCGNINHLAFNGQLTCTPPVGGPLTMIDDYGYLDHSENTDSATGVKTGFIADTEDDIAYVGTFRLTENEIYESLTIKVEAFNTVTDEAFTLKPIIFGFGGVQISNAGRYLLNESIGSISTLPTTSEKLNAKLQLYPTADLGSEYGVKVYFPILLRWEYWIPQQNANVDFWPTQNKDWEQYDNTGSWIVRTKLELVKDGLAYTHANRVTIEPYDNESSIMSSIQLLYGPGLTPIDVIPENSIMRLKSTHLKMSGNWNQSLVWGMLTVEPTESSPRWICSSVVPYDNNNANPLTPLSGQLINISFASSNVAVLECEVDSSKIDLSNGCDFTAKIKEKDRELITERKDAVGAYSFFKVSTDNVYLDTAPCVRVRRDTDNAEQDFGFVLLTGGLYLDVDAVESFVGALNDTANGYVVTWYDQSGENKHATAPTTAQQPMIVSGGQIVTDPNNGLAGMIFDGVDDYLRHSISTVPNPPGLFLSASVFQRTPGGVSFGMGSDAAFGIYNWFNDNNVYSAMGNILTGVLAGNDATSGSKILISWRDSANYVRIRINGSLLATMNYAYVAGEINGIGAGQIPFHSGIMQEQLFWLKDKSSEQGNIELNINDRYSIY